MKEKINELINPREINALFTLHNLGMLVIAVVALSVSWTSIKVIQRNYNLMKQISVLEQEVKLGEVLSANQKLMNEYYKTDTYLEIAARKQFNKALPGEQLMLVPKTVALRSLPSTNEEPNDYKQPEEKLKKWQQWVRFLSGRAISD